MQTKLLLPQKFKLIGFVLFLPSLVLGILYWYKEYTIDFLAVGKKTGLFGLDQNLTDELALSGMIVSLLFISFAKEKKKMNLLISPG